MRWNEITLKGPVIKFKLEEEPDENGYRTGKAVIGVIRGYRNIGDKRENVKIDRPKVMTRNEDIISKMITWNKNDIVSITGAIATKTVYKTSYCPYCKAKNMAEGITVYIEPIFVEKEFTCKDDSSSIQYLQTIREISNRARVCGNLCRDPKKITIKNGPTVTQYPLAAGRKFHIKEDPPSITTDFPWVKSYGQNAIDDRNRLHLGSEVIIDGIVQTRAINRKTICIGCGQLYDWKESVLELVPYEVEYSNNYYTEEEAAERELARKNERLKAAGLDRYFMSDRNTDYDNDEITNDDIDAGMDAMEDEE